MQIARLKFAKSTFFFGAVLALSGALVYYLISSTRSDLHRHELAIIDFTEARHYHDMLDEALLRSRTFHLDDYDSIIDLEQRLGRICAAESASPLHATSAEEIAEFCRVLREKYEAIERFKSANALVKNSLRYLPELVGEIADPVARERASAILIDLLQAAAGYRSGRAENRLERTLAVNRNGLTADFSRQAAAADRAIRARVRTEALIFTPSVETAIERLRIDYFREYRVERRRTTLLRNLLAFACLALGSILFLAFRRIQSARSDLAELNRTLESKVRDRTVELETALESLRESQAIVSQTTKMSALGEMAGGIAHEINTPLGTILLCAQMIESSATKSEDAALTKNARAIVTTVRRVAKIIQGLKRFCRDSSRDDRTKVSLRRVIDDTLVFCQEKLRTHGVEIRIGGELDVDVHCIPEQIGQVLLNLLSNSYDAISPRPAPLWIELRGARESGEAALYVSDCGPGIPPEVVDRMMQPFFTTKEVGKGTGLGLSISKGIVEAHGGTLVYVKDTPTTTFRLSMPEAIGLEKIA